MSQPPDWRPDETPLFRNRYARWARRWLLSGVVAVAVGVAFSVQIHPLIGMMIAAFGGTFALIFGAAFWYTARGVRAQLDRIRSGAVLARWSVDRDRYMAWHHERQHMLGIAALVAGGLVLLIGLVIAGMLYDDGEVVAAGWLGWGTFAAAVLTVYVARAHAPEEPPPSMRRVPMVIGPDGALTVAGYVQWQAFGVDFIEAAVDADPPTLRVRYTAIAKHGRVEHTLALPVPDDRLEEARAVAKALGEVERVLGSGASGPG